MTEHFDVNKKKEVLLSSVGLRMFQQETSDGLREQRALTSMSFHALNAAAYAFLAGLNESALQLVENVMEWVTLAIEEQERPMYYSPKGTEAQRFFCKAFAQWLLGSSMDEETVKLYVSNSTEYHLGKGKDKIGISFALPEYLAIEAYEPALYVWQQSGKFEPPPALGKISSEANMCYVVANCRLGREYSADDEQVAMSRFLKRHVDTKWLARGHALRAACWMKIAYWQSGNDPIETIMKCYDFL